MSQDDFLVWRNIAYQADAHLMEKGAMLPAETRLILARIRDLSERMGQRMQREWAEAEAAPAEAGGATPPGQAWHRLIVCTRAAVLLIALGFLISPVTLSPAGPEPAARMAGLGRPSYQLVRLHLHGFWPVRVPQMLAQDSAKLGALARLPLPVVLPLPGVLPPTSGRIRHRPDLPPAPPLPDAAWRRCGPF